MPRIAIFHLCLPQEFEAMQSTSTSFSGYRSASGSSMAIGPLVDLQWLLVRQWTFSDYWSVSGSSVAIGPPVDLL